jgi:hypothetical protein
LMMERVRCNVFMLCLSSGAKAPKLFCGTRR